MRPSSLQVSDSSERLIAVIGSISVRDSTEFSLSHARYKANLLKSYTASFFLLASSPTPSDVEVVILPGFPRVNSPLELRLFIRLRSDMNTTFTLASERLNTIMESFLRNISDAFGIEFTGICWMSACTL